MWNQIMRKIPSSFHDRVLHDLEKYVGVKDQIANFYERMCYVASAEIEQATRVATAQLNHRAKPWVWGRPPKTRRRLRRLFCYRI